MRKMTFVLIFTLTLMVADSLRPSKQAHAMGASMKTILTMSAYGAGGGALLGFASMAFGTKPKSIAVGASLGLYAGLLFGSYVILSYKYKDTWFNSSNWGDSPTDYDDNYVEGEEDDSYGGSSGGFFGGGQRAQEINAVQIESFNLDMHKEELKRQPDIYMNLFNMSF